MDTEWREPRLETGNARAYDRGEYFEEDSSARPVDALCLSLGPLAQHLIPASTDPLAENTVDSARLLALALALTDACVAVIDASDPAHSQFSRAQHPFVKIENIGGAVAAATPARGWTRTSAPFEPARPPSPVSGPLSPSHSGRQTDLA
jgi:hypothetical protein